MHWNFEKDQANRLRFGAVGDMLLFFFAVVALIGFAVLPTSSFGSGVLPGQGMFWQSFVFTGPLALVFLVAYVRWLRRSRAKAYLSPQPEELTVTYRIMNALVVLLVGGWALYGALNARLDSGPSRIYYTYVLDKTIDEDGRFENYNLTLANWDGGAKPLTLAVDSTFFGAVDVEDSCLRLVVRPGAFGLQWIEQHQHFEHTLNFTGGRDNWMGKCQAVWAEQTANRSGSGYAVSP
jgi:hypothetical protein